MKKNLLIMFFAFVFITGLCLPGMANVDQLKIYRKVYPDVKPACMYCHVSAKPKKDDGAHELNAYGLKAEEMAGSPLEEVYATLGRHDEFEAEEGVSAVEDEVAVPVE